MSICSVLWFFPVRLCLIHLVSVWPLMVAIRKYLGREKSRNTVLDTPSLHPVPFLPLTVWILPQWQDQVTAVPSWHGLFSIHAPVSLSPGTRFSDSIHVHTCFYSILYQIVPQYYYALYKEATSFCLFLTIPWFLYSKRWWTDDNWPSWTTVAFRHAVLCSSSICLLRKYWNCTWHFYQQAK